MEQEEIKDIIELYKTGNSYRIIAKQYNVSTRCISTLLKKHNVEIRTSYNKRFEHLKKPKYKSPYSRGKNPNSHGGADKRNPSPKYLHDLGKYRYKTRLPPVRCCFIKRNDEQCKKYCTPGARTCFYHGGRLYQLRIKTGTHSKILKRNIMHFLTQLSKEETKAIDSNDYSKVTLLDYQHKLSDILLSRSLKFLNESEDKLNDVTQEIVDLKNGGTASQGMTGLLITQASLLKNITTTHSIIQKHQEQIAKNLITQEQVIGTRDVKDSLNELTINIGKDSIGILTDLIQSYIASGAIENIDDIKALLPQQDYIAVKYEELDD